MESTPTHEARIGSIKASIWATESASGSSYAMVFHRLYQDGGAWKSTDTFGRDDLLLLGKVADIVHTWICKREQQGSPAAKIESLRGET